jgi:hypothetical protein
MRFARQAIEGHRAAAFEPGIALLCHLMSGILLLVILLMSPAPPLSQAVREQGKDKPPAPVKADKPGSGAAAESTGGEQLSSTQVSALPLNRRDFSQLLLLAAGTQTDTNGAANFTQQFTVNGQRGIATVFAMDGVDTTDPEMGGATFSNFNVDAIDEVKASSGVMPAEVGHGAAGYTEVVTKSGTNDLHGSVFEFVRNAAFDARNFFDRRSIAQPGRIPPFARNEFGFTNGGPLTIPGLYKGRGRTFYFGEYQGFRQVLGTTQVIPVPTAEERQGRDSTAFPGDVLLVPVDPRIARILAAYPMPNDAQGPYGARTYATSSKVRATTDQFSIRIVHRISDKTSLSGRFSLNNVEGPLTNPSQTAIDPSFAIRFFDHQRNAGLSLTHTPSPTFVSETYIGYLRSTPNFVSQNLTQPGISFGDGLYEGFNTASGSVLGSYGNLYQARQVFTWIRGKHAWKAGGEVRFNRDSTIFGTNPNGTYSFGGGAAYAPVAIRSQSGLHDIAPGALLPDSLTAFLSAAPFSYTITAAPPLFAQGERMDDAAVRRYAFNAFVQDAWKVSPRLTVNLGLRYEVETRIGEAAHRTSAVVMRPDGAHMMIDNRPPYPMYWKGLGPRASAEWKWNDKMVVRAGGSITTLLLNLWQQNFVTGGIPFMVAPFSIAAPGAPVPFDNSVATVTLPQMYTISGALLYPTGNSKDIKRNTEMDLFRFERELAALSSDKLMHPMSAQAVGPTFHDGYIGSWTLGVERRLSDLTINAAYVATAGVKLPRMGFPNGYNGADPAFAPYTNFDANGRPESGFASIVTMENASHSTYHSLQASLGKTSLRGGLGFQASYTFSKSIDDTSAVLGGFLSGSSGTILQTAPQNPSDLRSEKGPSTFDITHAVSFSAIQELRLDQVFTSAPRRVTRGWQLLGIGSLATGAPFTIYSGIQQTGVGSNSADRPDQIGVPALSTSRTVREDYFGRGAANPSFFSIPVGLAGGSGPNRGRFGTLGRDTFRGPAFHNFDFSLIKDTPIGHSGNPERVMLQFRAEVFNAFNIVNFGLPANIVSGPGFGVINRTAGPSRQIQLSLKILY